jgi:DNA polymerase III subunit delta
MSIVLLFGDDQFAIHEKLDFWRTKFIEKYGDDMNLDEIEGKTPPNQIIESAEALPFLGDKRLIIVKGFLEQQDSDSQKKMAELLERVPDSTTLVFLELATPDKRKTLYKKLQKEARFEECKPLIGNDLTEWIVSRARNLNSEIDWATATYLGSLITSDSWRLKNEIEKLSLHAKGKKITREIVDKMVSSTGNTTVFKLTDALGARQPKKAIQHLHQLVEKGEAVPMIFSMLVRQFRMIIQIKELQSQGLPHAQIASKIKQHPYAVSSMASQTQNFTEEELITIFEKLIKIDRGLKTGAFKYLASDQREYLLRIEQFILECCAAA